VRPPRPRSPRPDPGAGARLPLPDLAVLVGYQDPGLGAWLVRAGVAHLAVAAQEAIGVVGPLVRPGQTACLRCLDLTRAGLDSAWPLILAQLTGRAAEPAACDATLAATVAAQASTQALALIDRDSRSPAAENGTLELVQPSWQWRRRTWPAHPGCGCGAAGVIGRSGVNGSSHYGW
jgi:bacteriocin biosynthesis cyclodehydratase domain-containing protein